MLFTALEESMAFSCKARWVQSRENLGCTDRPVGIARNAFYRYFPHPPGEWEELFFYASHARDSSYNTKSGFRQT